MHKITLTSRRGVRSGIFGFFLMFLVGCLPLSEPYLDPWTVPWFGKSLHRSLMRVSVKQIHIELALFEGQHLWVEGTVSAVGDHNTHFVLSQGDRNLLVVQVNMMDFDERISAEDLHTHVGVVGNLELQKKGLPALYASLILKNAKSSPHHSP